MRRPGLTSVSLRMALTVVGSLLLLYLFATFLVDNFGVKIDSDPKETLQKPKTENKHLTQLEEYLFDTLVEGKYDVVVFKTKYGALRLIWKHLDIRFRFLSVIER